MKFHLLVDDGRSPIGERWPARPCVDPAESSRLRQTSRTGATVGRAERPNVVDRSASERVERAATVSARSSQRDLCPPKVDAFGTAMLHHAAQGLSQQSD